MDDALHQTAVTVNGRPYRRTVEGRMLLSDFIRHELLLAGTHVGCEHGVCGACTILYDGLPVRSCLMFAPQADGHELMTVEGLASGKDLHPLQEAMHECHGLQCGYGPLGALLRHHP
jgi:aerobic-type carbon monoxide dehydrogenase small subunit (CoxS/CutS family)